MLTRFGRDQAGGVQLVFGLVLPLLLGAVAAAVEYGLLVHRQDQLQNAADTGALAAARELSLAARNSDGTAGVARSVILATLRNATDVSIDTRVEITSVEVTVRETVKHHFGALLGTSSSQLAVKSRSPHCIEPPLPAGVGAGQAWGNRHEQERPSHGVAVLHLFQLERQGRYRGRGQRAH